MQSIKFTSLSNYKTKSVFVVVAKRRLFVSLFVAVVTSLLSAQTITVRDIPSLDKLPVNAVHRIFQDSEGYMWYGTFNGLCRDDGYSIRTFRSDFYHPGLLSDNYITYINEDHNKKIWFGTMKGAYILDKASSEIVAVNLGKFSDKNVYSINVTHDGTIWISVPGVLFRFASDGKLIKQYTIEYNKLPKCLFLVYEDKDGNLLISITGGGMYKLNKRTDIFEPYCRNENYMDIQRIIPDKTHGYYWLGTWGKGIVRFDPHAQSPDKQYIPQPFPVDITGNPNFNTFHMVQDDVFHYIWVTTQKDLYAFRITEDGMLRQVDTSPFLAPSNKMLYEIFKDRAGKLWVSAFDMKSFIVDIRENFVRKYTLPDLRNRIKANPAIVALYVDQEGMFWFAQERYGLCLYNPKLNKLSHYSDFQATRPLPLENVSVLCGSHSPGKVWVSSFGSSIYGVSRNGLNMENICKIELSVITRTPGIITSLFEDANNNLWIGTTTGLYFYTTQTATLEAIQQKTGTISGIAQTADGRIWVAVKNTGICSIDSRKQLKLYPFNKDFVCIDVNSEGNLWLGTAKGEVMMFETGHKKLIDHSLICGMKGDIVNHITVDIYNHVWITTNQMIKEYNPRNGAYKTYSTRNRNFLLSRLISNAVYYDRKSEIYFGGISGIISVPPSQQLEGIPEQVTTHISDIKIAGRSIWEDNSAKKMVHGILQVSPNDQNLELEFSSLDFHNLDQIRYAYRLVGVDKDWVYLSEGENAALYSHLVKGQYTFQVKATDTNGLWSNNVTELTIDRLPAWYETWWAYLIYILLILAICSYALQKYLKHLKKRNEEQWSDSAELVKMHQYLDSKKNQTIPEFAEIDKLLIDNVVRVVEQNLSDPEFNVETLAEKMNMSRSTLSRKIKSITGKTPLDLIKDIKMQHACLLLENKTATVADVIITLGYSDHRNFTQSFKDAFGMTPSEYHKNNSERPTENTE